MPNDSAMEKRELRRRVRLAFPGTEQRAEESRLICLRLEECEIFRRAGTIFAFVPMEREADLLPLLEKALRTGKKLALPRCGKPPEMTFHAVGALTELVPGAWNIPEPPESAPVLVPGPEDLVLVPLEAVDREGRRLGKGGGYYDRFLKECAGKAVGVALSNQLVDEVPAESHDVALKLIVHAGGIIIR